MEYMGNLCIFHSILVWTLNEKWSLSLKNELSGPQNTCRYIKCILLSERSQLKKLCWTVRFRLYCILQGQGYEAIKRSLAAALGPEENINSGAQRISRILGLLCIIHFSKSRELHNEYRTLSCKLWTSGNNSSILTDQIVTNIICSVPMW